MDFKNFAPGACQLRFDDGKLAAQFALQEKCPGRARIVAGQPSFRVGDALRDRLPSGRGRAPAGQSAHRRRLAVDADGLREVCPFQSEIWL
jgi:hypothetical protein